MKLAISSRTSGLDAEVDQRFGRAPWFVFYDVETETAESVANEGRDGLQGVGIATAQMVVDHGADVVVTGVCGPKARQVLDAADVTVIEGASGTVGSTVAANRAGKTPAVSVDVPFVGGGGGRGHCGRGGGGRQ